VVGLYYESDQVVEEDQELQDFVKDVYVYGMRGRKASGGAAALCRCSEPLDPSRNVFPMGSCSTWVGSQDGVGRRCSSWGGAHGPWLRPRLPQVHQEQGEAV
jgi:hypothetical protein